MYTGAYFGSLLGNGLMTPIQQERDAVRSRLSQLDFNYTPPPGFDMRKVKGLVASLLALKPEDHGKSTALEIAAGASCAMS